MYAKLQYKFSTNIFFVIFNQDWDIAFLTQI